MVAGIGPVIYKQSDPRESLPATLLSDQMIFAALKPIPTQSEKVT
jgi:hypothetical protein